MPSPYDFDTLPRFHAGGVLGSSPDVWMSSVNSTTLASEPTTAGVTYNSTVVNLGGVKIDSKGQMDSMAETRAAQRIVEKATRAIQRRTA